MKSSHFLTFLLSLFLCSCGSLFSGTEVENEVQVAIHGNATTTMALSHSPIELRSSKGTLLAQTQTDSNGNFNFENLELRVAQWVEISSPGQTIKTWIKIGAKDSNFLVPVDGLSTALSQNLDLDLNYQRKSDSLIQLWLGQGIRDTLWQRELGGPAKVRQILSATLMKSWDQCTPLGTWVNQVWESNGSLLNSPLIQSNFNQVLVDTKTSTDQGATILQKTTNTGTVDEWQKRLDVIDPSKTIDSNTIKLGTNSLSLLEKCISYAQKSVFVRSGAQMSNTQMSWFQDLISKRISPDLSWLESQGKLDQGSDWWIYRCGSLGVLFGVVDTTEWQNPNWTLVWQSIEQKEFGTVDSMLTGPDLYAQKARQSFAQPNSYWTDGIQKVDSSIRLWGR